MTIKAVTFDLDDTLWPIAPTILRAEQVLQAWLERHAPAVALAYPPETMRTLRPEAMAHAEANGTAHDLRGVRRYQIGLAFARAGADARLVEDAYRVFEHQRQEVELYPDVAVALEAIASRYAIGGITNGFADLERTGIGRHFRFSLAAGEFGIAKPDPSIFRAACDKLGHPPEHVLHVGDDPHTDILGARRVGMHTAWINRRSATWVLDEAPHAEFAELGALVEWLDNRG